VEAATTFGWERYADDSIGIDRFGASAPGDVVLDRLGINVEHVVTRAGALARPGRSGPP
jgi:transketolase